MSIWSHVHKNSTAHSDWPGSVTRRTAMGDAHRPPPSGNRRHSTGSQRTQRHRHAASAAQNTRGGRAEFEESNGEGESQLSDIQIDVHVWTQRRQRSYSISMTDPVSHSTYSSIPQSPATQFLARFAMTDEEAALRRSTNSLYSPDNQPADGHWRNGSGSTVVAPDAPEDCFGVEHCHQKTLFKLGRVLGRGTFTECREAIIQDDRECENVQTVTRHCNGHFNCKSVAVKIYRRHQTTNVTDAELQHEDVFEHELQIWRCLDHPHILPLHAAVSDSERMMAVSMLAENGSMLDYIARNGPFREENLTGRRIFRQLASAVDYLHRQAEIAHRDIKLENVLLDSEMRPYLCDFGLSEELSNDNELHSYATPVSISDGDSRRHFLKGSLWYMAPEEVEFDEEAARLLGTAELRRRADVWSLGVVLYAMVAGRLPFTDDLLPRLQQTIAAGKYPPLSVDRYSPELLRLVSRLLTVRVADRHPLHVILAEETWHREDGSTGSELSSP